MRVSKDTLKKLDAFLASLPPEQLNKCTLCRETLTHLTKTAEVTTGAPTATVTKKIAEKHNLTAAPQDRVSGNALNQRIRQNEGNKKRNDDLFKRLVIIGSGSGANGYIYFAQKEHKSFKIGQTESSPQGRISSLNGYGVDEWKFIHAVELPASAVTKKVESYIHEEFSIYHIEKELFRSECLREAIAFTDDLAAWLWDTVKQKMSVGHNKIQCGTGEARNVPGITNLPTKRVNEDATWNQLEKEYMEHIDWFKKHLDKMASHRAWKQNKGRIMNHIRESLYLIYES